MKKHLLIYTLLFCGILPLRAQPPLREIKLSQLFFSQRISLFEPARESGMPSLYDTVRSGFLLTNDTGGDTAIYYSEGYNEWFLFSAAPVNSPQAALHQLSGREYYGLIPYDNVYYPAQKLFLKNGITYKCEVSWKGCGYFRADTLTYLLTAAQYLGNSKRKIKTEYTNHIITYFFTGAVCFGFLLFLLLYYKSRYPLFGLYAAFLFLQLLYGLIQFDVYTIVGGLFITHFRWDEYVPEILIFSAQVIYVRFITGWLKVAETNVRLAAFFRRISYFFLCYTIVFFILYSINSYAGYLLPMRIAIRGLGLLFQLYLFYNIIFKIKTPGRWYILAGSLMLVTMGVVMVFIHERNGFNNTVLEDIDNGSWYMLGVLGECFCFTMGMALHYFELQNEKNKLQIEKNKLQIENLEARQLQLEAEEASLKDRLRISQDLHDNVGSALSSITVFSKVAQLHGGQGKTEEMKEVLGRISSTSKEMMTEMNDIVWAISPRNDNLEKIIQRMESFAKPLLTAGNIRFRFAYGREVFAVNLDMNRRKNFYLIFKEAVTNAIKYSGATELTVDIRLRGQGLELLIKDNGEGFNPEKEAAAGLSLSGNGLQNMQARSKEMNALFHITAGQGKGTEIQLICPV
jgi:signal transduction histidine kinase